MRRVLTLLSLLVTPAVAHAQLTWHARIAPVYMNEATSRGGWSVGALNWGGAGYATGAVAFNVMASAEAYTFSDCGYSQVLATDPNCASRARDISAAHPVLMDASITIRQRVRDLDVRAQAGLVGEPAFGPAAYMHRASSAYDPVAPYTHHLTNTHHAAHSVFTLDVSSARFGVAASAFDSRDRHANAKGVDPRTPDALAGRLSYTPSATTRLTLSSASLPASGHAGHAATDERSAASFATFERTQPGSALLAMVGYHAVGPGIRIALIEGNVTRGPYALFSRIEAADALEEQLDIVINPDGSHAHDVTLFRSAGGKLVAGGAVTRTIRRVATSIGARGSLSVIPERRRALYDGRTTVPGFSVFVMFNARSAAAHHH